MGQIWESHLFSIPNTVRFLFWFIVLNTVLFCLPQPQILQPNSHIPNEPLMQGKLARTVPTGGHNDACTEGEHTPTSCPPVPCTNPPFGDPHVESKSLPDPEELSWLLSTHLRIQDNESNSQEAGEQIARPTPERRQKTLLQTPHTLPFSPRFLQPPRLHKRVTLPALHIGGSSGSNPKPGPSVNHKAHQLLPPPPSRGLPCYSAGNHVVTRGRLSQPWPAVVRREADPKHNASVPLGISTRLAKPKNHWASAAAIDTDKATSLNAWSHAACTRWCC